MIQNNNNEISPLLTQALAHNSLEIDSAIFSKVILYLNEIILWNQKFNLTAHRSPHELIYKDIIDILCFLRFFSPILSIKQSILDMGAGAGFCGVLAALCYPSLEVGFLESSRKKMNFIRHIARVLALKSCSFIQVRAESKPERENNRWCMSVSRATWNMVQYLQNVHYYVQNSGQIFFMAGPSQIISSETSLPGDFELSENYSYLIEPDKFKRNLYHFQKKISST